MITLDGEVASYSNMDQGSQQLVVSKSGTLWLIDYEDFVTVKVSSIHTAPVNKAQVISSGQAD